MPRAPLLQALQGRKQEHERHARATRQRPKARCAGQPLSSRACSWMLSDLLVDAVVHARLRLRPPPPSLCIPCPHPPCMISETAAKFSSSRPPLPPPPPPPEDLPLLPMESICVIVRWNVSCVFTNNEAKRDSSGREIQYRAHNLKVGVQPAATVRAVVDQVVVTNRCSQASLFQMRALGAWQSGTRSNSRSVSGATLVAREQYRYTC